MPLGFCVRKDACVVEAVYGSAVTRTGRKPGAGGVTEILCQHGVPGLQRTPVLWEAAYFSAVTGRCPSCVSEILCPGVWREMSDVPAASQEFCVSEDASVVEGCLFLSCDREMSQRCH